MPESDVNQLLGRDATQLDRLQLEARTWEAAARAMLREINVRPGWVCADVGCGALGIVGPLSEAVGPEGRVIGFDSDPMVLGAIRHWLAAEGLTNVEVLKADAYNTGLPRAAFDLVHARFLFAPLGRDDELLREMKALARRGGVVAAQEPDAASWSCFPPTPSFTALKKVILETFRQGGGDFDAGRRMYAMMRSAGLTDVQVRPHVLVLKPGHPYRRSPLQFVASLRPRILEAGLLSERELDSAAAEFERVAADHHTVMTTFTVLQTWGRKP